MRPRSKVREHLNDLRVTGPIRTFYGTREHVMDIGEAGILFPPSGSGISFKRGPGPLLPQPNIMPIFWGAEWVSASPPIAPATLLASLETIIDGPYLDALAQYGAGGKPTLLAPRYISGSEPGTGAPNSAYWASMGRYLLDNLIDEGSLAEPDEDWSRFTVIFMPSTFAYPPDAQGRTVYGFHASFQWQDYDLFDVDNDPVRYAMVGTAPQNGVSGLDMATSTFSHELVEAITDPDGKGGWRRSPSSGTPSSDELADAPCSQIARLNGVAVSSYWSMGDNACIIPGVIRQAYLRPAQELLNSERDGPAAQFYVERDCGREHHWSGAYTYHLALREVTVILQAHITNWVSPTIAWRVAGQPVATGVPVTLTPTIPVSFPAHPNSVTTMRTVTLTATATGTTLTLVNDPSDGSYSVPILFTVSELFNDGSGKDSRSWNVDVDIDGQQLVYSQGYVEALSQCLGARVKSLRSDMKGVREVYAELAEFLLKHRGPPVAEGIVDPLLEAALDHVRDLRVLAKDLGQVPRLVR